MFSEKALSIADACRFCWMCRHLCPIGLKTGREINGPRAKGLLVSLCERGETFDSSIAEAMWECALCGACTNDCATGYEPPVFIREARSEALALDLAPDYVYQVLDRIEKTGSMYGITAAERMAGLMNGREDGTAQADVLLYVGEVAAVKAPHIAIAMEKLLQKAGTSFTVLADEPESGAYLGDLIGFVEDVRQKAAACAAAIHGTGASLVVVLDPVEARIMKHQYPQWGIELRPRIVTATSYLDQLVDSGQLTPRQFDRSATLHDTGALARELGEEEPVRSLLTAMGIRVQEMFLNRRLSKSCGGALLACYAPRLSELTARGRWEDALHTGQSVLVTESPASWSVLADHAPDGMEVRDVIELLAEACEA